eukprot:m.205976 g.205976  ORF g.205976 m.205976 type:complete len:863 (-) comp26055_c0_seq3:134-2722(-)
MYFIVLGCLMVCVAGEMATITGDEEYVEITANTILLNGSVSTTTANNTVSRLVTEAMLQETIAGVVANMTLMHNMMNGSMQALYESLRAEIMTSLLGPTMDIEISVLEGSTVVSRHQFAAPLEYGPVPQVYRGQPTPTAILNLLRSQSFCQSPSSQLYTVRVKSPTTTEEISVSIVGSPCEQVESYVSNLANRIAVPTIGPQGGGALNELKKSLDGSLNATQQDMQSNFNQVFSQQDSHEARISLAEDQIQDQSTRVKSLDTELETSFARTNQDLGKLFNVSNQHSLDLAYLMNSSSAQGLFDQKVTDCHLQGKIYNAQTDSCDVALTLSCSKPHGTSFSAGECGLQPGGSCTLLCASGFVGDSVTVLCQSNGEWSTNTIDCQPVSCPAPDAAALGLANTDGYVIVASTNQTYQSVLTVNCKEGYSGAGATFTCGANGQWQGRAHCEPVDCGSTLPFLGVEAQFTCPSTTFDSPPCQVLCPSSGLVTNFTCGADGNWQVSDPTFSCEKPTSAAAFRTVDAATGCPNGPPTRAYVNVTVQENTTVVFTGSLIRKATGRIDLWLMQDGKIIDRSLSYSSSFQWVDMDVYWVGTLAPGSYSFWLQPASNPELFGCTDWGQLQAFTLSSALATAYQISLPTGGCPRTLTANAEVIGKTINVDYPAVVFVRAHAIRRVTGRSDLYLYRSGVELDISLTYTSSSQWEDAEVTWIGRVPAGESRFTIASPTASAWGCGPEWTDMDVIVFDPQADVDFFHVVDERQTCPGPTIGGSVLAKSFTMKQTGVVHIQSSIIRLFSGRADLLLYVDGVRIDRSLSYTSSRQWEDVHVAYDGVLAAGSHSVYVVGSGGDIWGCRQRWGSLDILIMY